MGSYTKTTWNTGDVITATKLNNLETQHEKALLLSNLQALIGETTGAAPVNLAYVNAANDAIFGDGANQDDTKILSGIDVIMMPNGVETGRFIDASVLKMIQNIEIEKGTPTLILDRDGTGQYMEVHYKDGSTLHLSAGYDHTSDLWVIRNNGVGAAIFSVDPNTRWITTDNQPRASAEVVTPISVSASNRTALTFDTLVYDNDSILDIGGSNPTRVTFATAGRYLMTAKVHIDEGTGGGGSQRYAVFDHSGALGDFGLVEFNYGVGDVDFSMCSIQNMAATEYVELDVFHDSGASEGVTAEIQVQRLLG
jgi:hypothetical protein